MVRLSAMTCMRKIMILRKREPAEMGGGGKQTTDLCGTYHASFSLKKYRFEEAIYFGR